jgi:hypothetical protein
MMRERFDSHDHDEGDQCRKHDEAQHLQGFLSGLALLVLGTRRHRWIV